MKKNLHPKYHKIKVEMTDGSQFETMSTWGSENEVLKLEIDPKSHAAWTGGKQKIMDKGRISKFNKKFSNFRTEKIMSEVHCANGNCSLVGRKYIFDFKQIADFCKMHEVEIQGIADGEVGKGIVGSIQ